jgi:hypothetical protein
MYILGYNYNYVWYRNLYILGYILLIMSLILLCRVLMTIHIVQCHNNSIKSIHNIIHAPQLSSLLVNIDITMY